jgi:hypothetical protein
MGFLGSLASFAIGVAAGAAGGVAGARLLAPQSGDDTQQAVSEWKNDIATAGASARAATEAALENQYRFTLNDAAKHIKPS